MTFKQIHTARNWQKQQLTAYKKLYVKIFEEINCNFLRLQEHSINPVWYNFFPLIWIDLKRLERKRENWLRK